MRLVDFAAVPPRFDAPEWCDQGSFFNRPEWYALVAAHGLPRASRAAIALTEDGRAGLAFCRFEGDRILRSCTDLYTCEFSLLGSAPGADAIGSLIAELLQSAKPLDGIQLEGFDPADPAFPIVLQTIRQCGFIAKPYLGWANWYEKTHGNGFEQFLSGRPSVLRNTWKRKSSQLDKSARWEVRYYQDVRDPEPLIGMYEQLREQSWKDAEPYPEFLPALIRLAAGMGALRFGILDIEAAPAAAQVWLVWAGKATIFKLVHAERFGSHSPGTLLTMAMVRNILEQDRPSEIDFGRGNDNYKQLWLRARRDRWGIEAANPRTSRGLLRSGRITLALLRQGSIERRRRTGSA